MQLFLGNIVWPVFLYLAGLKTSWIFLAGLLVEWPCIRWGANNDWPRAGVLTLCLNFVSCALGWIIVPLLGILSEVFAGHFENFLSYQGHYSLFCWIVTYLIALALSACIEWTIAVLLSPTKLGNLLEIRDINPTRMLQGIILANLLSNAIAVIAVAFGKHIFW